MFTDNLISNIFESKNNNNKVRLYSFLENINQVFEGDVNIESSLRVLENISITLLTQENRTIPINPPENNKLMLTNDSETLF